MVKRPARLFSSTTLRTATDRTVFSLVRCWVRLRYYRICRWTTLHVGKRCDPVKPVSDLDKFLWRKIFDHNPLFTTACDKLAAKQYALSVCPELKTAKVLWVGSDPDQIPAQVLSGNVVIKANCCSGANIMVFDGKVDRAALRETTRLWLQRIYGQEKGEWGYKNGRHCLFVEEMLRTNGQPIQQEYKFHVSGGRVAYVFVARRDERGKYFCHLGRDGQLARVQKDGASTQGEIIIPATFDRLAATAERLGASFDYMRCDFYERDGEIFFSELTPYPQSGLSSGIAYLDDLRGAQWDLRKSWFLSSPQRGWRKAYSAALRRWLDGGCQAPSF
ncbi:MAG: hypothetical protein K2Y71_29450 [Xanthobacteraceae bacterium]|nr:hypothetical protein [Xanthobacteraceae bacterium]